MCDLLSKGFNTKGRRGEGHEEEMDSLCEWLTGLWRACFYGQTEPGRPRPILWYPREKCLVAREIIAP